MKKAMETYDVRDEYEQDKDGNPDVGSTDCRELDVVGESFNKDAILAVFTTAPNKFGENNSIAEIDVVLLPETGNKYDKNAVRVDALLGIVKGEAKQLCLGHLSRDNARSFRKAFPDQVMIAKAHIDGSYWMDHNEGDFSVTIQIPETTVDKYDWEIED